jgi:hypothetical protein
MHHKTKKGVNKPFTKEIVEELPPGYNVSVTRLDFEEDQKEVIVAPTRRERRAHLHKKRKKK